MTVLELKNIIYTLCSWNPMLTNNVLNSLLTKVLSDISHLNNGTPSYQDITLTSNIYEYRLNYNIISINNIQYGDVNSFSESKTIENYPITLSKDKYNIIYKTYTDNNNITYKYTPYLQLLFSPIDNYIIRVNYNETFNSIDLFNQEDNTNVDEYINPNFIPILIDGIIAYFKYSVLKDETSQLFFQLYKELLDKHEQKLFERIEYI